MQHYQQKAVNVDSYNERQPRWNVGSIKRGKNVEDHCG